MCFRKFLVTKNVRDKRGGLTIFRQIVLSHNTESFRRGTFLCFRKIRVSKIFMPKRGLSQFSIETLMSHSTEKLRRRTLLCFTNFLVSKKLLDKRAEGGSITIFCQNFFVSQCRKIS